MLAAVMNNLAKLKINPKFVLGCLVMTRGVESIVRSGGIGFNPLPYVKRHASGDWGDICEDDKQANEDALVHGGRIFSAYNIELEYEIVRLYVITEWDRSVTTLLLSAEY